MAEEPHTLGTIEEYAHEQPMQSPAKLTRSAPSLRVASTAQSPAPSSQAVMHGEDSDEEFVYPGTEAASTATAASLGASPKVLSDATTLTTTVEVGPFPSLLQAEEDEEFVYPGSGAPSAGSSEAPSQPLSPQPPEPEAEAVPEPQSAQTTPAPEAVQEQPRAEEPSSSIARPATRHPSPVELDVLINAAQAGDLSQLRNIFKSTLQSGDVERFALANDASPRSGLTALHIAASRGHLEVARWCKFSFRSAEHLLTSLLQ